MDTEKKLIIKNRIYSCLIAFWGIILAINISLIVPKLFFKTFPTPIASSILFFTLIGISSFLVFVNFFVFLKVQSDKLKHDEVNDKVNKYDYHSNIVNFAVISGILSILLTFLAIFFIAKHILY